MAQARDRLGRFASESGGGKRRFSDAGSTRTDPKETKSLARGYRQAAQTLRSKAAMVSPKARVDLRGGVRNKATAILSHLEDRTDKANWAAARPAKGARTARMMAMNKSAYGARQPAVRATFATTGKTRKKGLEQAAAMADQASRYYAAAPRLGRRVRRTRSTRPFT